MDEAVHIGRSMPCHRRTLLAKRPPRKLDYQKCDYCRKNKVKCKPGNYQWPGERCDRCVQKNLPCSAPKKKTSADTSTAKQSTSGITTAQGIREITQGIEASTERVPIVALAMDQDHEDTTTSISDEMLHDVLCSVSMKVTYCLAFEEAQLLLQEWVDFMGPNHEVASNFAWVGGALRECEDAIHSLYRIVTPIQESDEIADLIATACFDMHYAPPIHGNNDALVDQNRKIQRYIDLRYYYVAYVVQMKRLISHPELAEEETARFLLCRNKLQSSRDGAIRDSNHDLTAMDAAILKTQPFVPKQLLRIPRIMEDVRRDGRQDFLYRSAGHLAHDAGLRGPWPASCYFDYDIFDRSALHLAFLRSDSKLLNHECSLSSDWHKEAIGATPVYMLFKSGGSDLVRNARREIIEAACWATIKWPVALQRSLINRVTVLGFAETVEAFNRQHVVLGSLGVGTETDGRRVMLAAAAFGYIDVVKALLKYVGTDIADDPDCYKRTPFWLAASRGHLDVLTCLGNSVNVDRKDVDGCTPLAAAVESGCTECVRYLLNLNSSALMRVNPNCLLTRGLAPFQQFLTPLDLAIARGYKECVGLLKSHGALSSKDMDDESKDSR